eukprot:scaffold35307_cov63-Phaeocystis_antarctica.AAC.3
MTTSQKRRAWYAATQGSNPRLAGPSPSGTLGQVCCSHIRALPSRRAWYATPGVADFFARDHRGPTRHRSTPDGPAAHTCEPRLGQNALKAVHITTACLSVLGSLFVLVTNLLIPLPLPSP